MPAGSLCTENQRLTPILKPLRHTTTFILTDCAQVARYITARAVPKLAATELWARCCVQGCILKELAGWLAHSVGRGLGWLANYIIGLSTRSTASEWLSLPQRTVFLVLKVLKKTLNKKKQLV